jgi:hypothetical protein
MSPAFNPALFFTSDRKALTSELLLLGQIDAKPPLGEERGLLDSLNDAGLTLVGKRAALFSRTDAVDGRDGLWLTRLLGTGARGTGDKTS